MQISSHIIKILINSAAIIQKRLPNKMQILIVILLSGAMEREKVRFYIEAQNLLSIS